MANAIEAQVDSIAGRLTALGRTALETARIVAQKSSLSEYLLEIFDGRAHVDALSTAMANLGKRIRQGIDETDKLGDADSADLLTEISREIDKLLWFVEARIQS